MPSVCWLCSIFRESLQKLNVLPTSRWAVGPCADRPHGEQCCAVQLPGLLQLAAEASATKGDPAAQKAKLEAVMAAVEAVFASPGYLLAACRRQPQRRRPSSEEQGLAGEAATEPMDSSPRAEQQEQQEGVADAGLAAEQEGHATHAQQTAAGPAAASQQQQQQQQQQPDDAGLDLQRIAAIYQALLKLYDADVAAVLGHTCVRLLDSEWLGLLLCCELRSHFKRALG